MLSVLSGTDGQPAAGPQAVPAHEEDSHRSLPAATPAQPPPVPAPVPEDEHINTDGRLKLDWESHYPPRAIKSIRFEAFVISAIFVCTVVAIFLTWRGIAFDVLTQGCATCKRSSFNQYAYFFLGGQLGGILFGIKYMYKAVARGFWNMDRRLWRFFTPFLSGGLAFAVGALIDSGIMGLTTKASTGAAYLSLGFVTGYFADSALAKMQEIAETVFGSPDRRKQPK